MLTSLDCLPCFLKQTLYTARLAAADETKQASIMAAVAKILPDLDRQKTPPENSIPIYTLIAQLTGCPDPFLNLKQQSNRLAMNLAEELKPHINDADDPLLEVLKLAIAGNIIDYGAHQDFDLDQAVAESLIEIPAVNHFNRLSADLKKVRSILYLADNCGELVFDGLVLEQLPKSADIILAVKEKPIINDALLQDAEECGLNKYADLISNGTSCPGTPLELCSPEFLKIFNRVDLIISKGQGNFETLSEIKAPIYFLLTVKCPIVAGHVNDLLNGTEKPVTAGDHILMRTPNWSVAI